MNTLKKIIISLVVVVLIVSLFFIYKTKTSSQTRVSTFGQYQGYSEAVYDGTKRTSEYLTLSDGTKLAYDLVIPTKKGVPADKALPVLFKYTPYGRTWTIFDKSGNFLVGDFVDLTTRILATANYWIKGDKGRIMDPLWRDKWLGTVVKHGYIVVSVDRPGTGASFASPTPGSIETAAKFENEIINWIVSHPWSDGNVAMYGDSQQAQVQLAAASAGNPHLKAILPAASPMDMYPSVEYPGGVFDKAFSALYAMVPLLDKVATPVDSDPDGLLLAQAVESRKGKIGIQNAQDVTVVSPYRDSIISDGTNPYLVMDLSPFIDRINQSHTAIYMTVGWYDIFTEDMFYWYNNLRVPKRLTVRPTDHSQVSANLADLDYGAEALRWLDYWLKGIDNGIMAEPPIHYYAQDGANKGTWQTSDQWPLSNQQSTAYYLAPGKSGSSASVNDGGLVMAPSALDSSKDVYTVDYTTTTGTKTRWGAIEEPHSYPDLSSHDAKALTYTTAPLTAMVNVTGHPVAHLWLSTAAPDLDAFVYLEVVDNKGKSTYVTEGNLRASHRKPGQAPFDNLGLPYHTHYQTDLEPIPANQPFELTFSLLPTSYQFHPGDRIRITVAFADAGNFDTPVITPAPTVQILRDAAHPSFVEMPVVK